MPIFASEISFIDYERLLTSSQPWARSLELCGEQSFGISGSAAEWQRDAVGNPLGERCIDVRCLLIDVDLELG